MSVVLANVAGRSSALFNFLPEIDDGRRLLGEVEERRKGKGSALIEPTLIEVESLLEGEKVAGDLRGSGEDD